MWKVEADDGAVTITLGWVAAALCARRVISIPRTVVRSVEIAPRRDLEAQIENRVLGLGTSVGRRLQGRTRVGRFLGRPVVGEQFWAVRRGAHSVIVIDCHPPRPFARVVIGRDEATSAGLIPPVSPP